MIMLRPTLLDVSSFLMSSLYVVGDRMDAKFLAALLHPSFSAGACVQGLTKAVKMIATNMLTILPLETTLTAFADRSASVADADPPCEDAVSNLPVLKLPLPASVVAFMQRSFPTIRRWSALCDFAVSHPDADVQLMPHRSDVNEVAKMTVKAENAVLKAKKKKRKGRISAATAKKRQRDCAKAVAEATDEALVNREECLDLMQRLISAADECRELERIKKTRVWRQVQMIYEWQVSANAAGS